MTEETYTSQEAIRHIAEFYGVKSYYAMAKALSDDTLNVQPIQIRNYFLGKNRMSRKVANRIQETYDIIVSDVYEGGVLDFKS